MATRLTPEIIALIEQAGEVIVGGLRYTRDDLPAAKAKPQAALKAHRVKGKRNG